MNIKAINQHPNLNPTKECITKSAEGFTAAYFRQFLEVMMPSEKTDKLNGGFAEQQFNTLIIEQYADILSKAQNGITPLVAKYLEKR